MLISTKANRYANQLIDARAHAKLIPLLSDGGGLSARDGYDIGKRILDASIGQGETPIGRKLGFTNRTIWSKYGVTQAINAPIWAHVFDSTVRYAKDNRGIQSLDGASQPRIEPEVVFGLGATPAPDASIEELVECIEWMAHAFEIVVCPFRDWKFEAVDAIAAFGLHGTLIVGEPHVLSSATRRNLASMLANASVSLSCCTEDSVTLCGAGFGSDVLDSPVHALWHLHQELNSQPQFAPLQAGEIITTGTWTDAYPVQAGQTWVTAFSGIALPGLTVSFV
ncbi:2-keto-4-pentenoate hydratase [Paraherbaspirillum soli]|uniref:2-keto-4-pentenoate hydratase n=1 Tax=Paraherbaspirillum soli TaxID=631222 RepID=A0ABW0MHC1_9BURK